jgi:hypothetical protein
MDKIMITLFTKPIKRATVVFSNEQVINSYGGGVKEFKIDVWIDPINFETNTEAKRFIDGVRIKFQEAYRSMMGEVPIIWFDFESDTL